MLILGACRDSGVEPERSQLAFVRDPSYDTVYIADPGTGAIDRQIPLPSGGSRFRLSPRGDRVAFISAGQLQVMKVDGSSLVPLAAHVVNMSWSPDGTRLVFDVSTATGAQLHVIGASGANEAVIPGAVPGGFAGLAWSPDGARIAFEGMRGGARTIFLVNPDGSDLRDFDLSLPGPDPRSTGEPTWSPDGRQLAFERYDPRTGETRLWVANVATNEARQITSSGGLSDVRPTWSPGGRMIAFLRFNGGDRSDVYVVAPNGSGARQLTATPAIREEEPQWLPR